MTDDTAAASAGAEPLTPDANRFTPTLACASPPRNRPRKNISRSMIRWVSPALFISSPTSTKNGMASSSNESTPPTIVFASTVAAPSPVTASVTSAEAAIAMNTGTPNAMSPKRTPKSSRISIRTLRLPPAEERGARAAKSRTNAAVRATAASRISRPASTVASVASPNAPLRVREANVRAVTSECFA